MHLLIDADMLAHAAANLYSGKQYLLDYSGGSMQVTRKRELNDICFELGIDKKEIRIVYVDTPLENALHTIKLRMGSIIKETGATSYQNYVSGQDNYRMDVCPNYKANRVGVHKPQHLDACFEYLIDRWDAIVCDGEEADDALGINQTEDTCICSLDKDLNCIPGWHYNWKTKTKYWVSGVEALRCFYKQLITGDTIDNISGLSEKAPKRRLFPTKPLDLYQEESQMANYVFTGYCYKYCDDAPAEYLRNGRLLWIRQKEGEIWDGYDTTK